MSENEIIIAVCKKLPELICLARVETEDIDGSTFYGDAFCFRSMKRPINWPTEGLQVCHEAEKLLTVNERVCFIMLLLQIDGSTWAAEHATYKQRLEALCRVWFPERFK